MFIMDDEQSDVGTWMCHQRCYVEDMALNAGLHLISSSEGFQREAGGSLPLGVVGTPTNEFRKTKAVYIISINNKVYI